MMYSYVKLPCLLLVFLLLLGCKPEKKQEAVVQRPTNEKPIAIPKPEKKPDLWKSFWKMFQTAVAAEDVETLIKHIEFPLKGSEAFNNGKQISKEKFSKHVSKIFDETAKAIFRETENMSEFATKKQKIADQLNVPINKKVRTILAISKKQNGKKIQTKSSVTFQFVEVEQGVFKLYSLVTAI